MDGWREIKYQCWELEGVGHRIERRGHGFEVWILIDPVNKLRKLRGLYPNLPAAKRSVPIA